MGPGDAIAAGGMAVGPIVEVARLAGVPVAASPEATPMRGGEGGVWTWLLRVGSAEPAAVELDVGVFFREWWSGREGRDGNDGGTAVAEVGEVGAGGDGVA